MLSRLLTIYRIVRRVHGKWISPLFTGWLIINFQIFTRVTLLIDKILFPGYRKRQVDRPIFITGNPRSGTTVLQRFLADSGEVISFQVWQMIVPSIIGQKILKPFIPYLAAFNPAKHYGKEAHETNLDAVETDEALLSFRFLDGLFVLLFFYGWGENDEATRLLEGYAAGSPKNKMEMEYYHDCLRRNLHISGKPRVLGKPFTHAMRITDALAEFPDAKMIYMVRDPASVIPSGINMLSNVTDKQFGTSKLPAEVKQRYYDNLYKAEIELYRRFHDDYKAGRVPPENVMIVRFPDLMQDFEKVMTEIFEFTGIEIDDQFKEEVERQAEKQRNYVSGHKYDLAKFGLTEEQIHKDLDFVYETFDL